MIYYVTPLLSIRGQRLKVFFEVNKQHFRNELLPMWPEKEELELYNKFKLGKEIL